MGEVFAGRYELLEPVAEGGMGSVWEVLDRSDDRVKAAKILRQSDAASLLRFVREQSMRIDHDHVVTPQSWAGMDDRVLFTMPLVRGGSVSSLLSDFGPLPLRWVGTLLDQTLNALEAVHAAGIVHRDVKPANLLLEPTGRSRPHLRLTDFGIAAPLDEPRMTRATMSIGTPGYMAPEQWEGADPDPSQDLYAVGVVGLEMLTARRPGATKLTVDPAELPEPRPVAQRLVALLERASSDDPAARPTTATELRRELLALELEHLGLEDDVEVFDHFSAQSGAPTGARTDARTDGRTDGRGGAPSGARATAVDQDHAATENLRSAARTSRGRRTAAETAVLARDRRSPLPGLVLVIVGLVSLFLAAAVALSA
ncbi:MAG TPA: serine/threonine-protein kinase [Nocardioides sp.]|jgi:serine/threonine-protein kinase